MRIALDTNALCVTKAGTARYVKGLIQGIQSLKADDIELTELSWPVENLAYQQPQRALKTVYREFIWARWTAVRRLKKGQFDLLHSPAGFFIQPPPSVPNVITLLDLAVVRFPERFRSWQRQSTAGKLNRLHQAAKVICISRFTAQEAMDLLKFPSHKLEVVYCGCELTDSTEAAAEDGASEFEANGFFLFVGSLEPGKHLALLKQVYALAGSHGVHLPPLMIVGDRWEGVAGEGPPPAHWRYLGRLPDATLAGLYRKAAALVFPSKYEGFGLPVAEAMSMGCPVICSPVASLPEVGGNAAIYCEATPQAYLKAMLDLLNYSALRDECIAKGLEQARKFTWRSCAEQTVSVYRQVLKG